MKQGVECLILLYLKSFPRLCILLSNAVKKLTKFIWIYRCFGLWLQGSLDKKLEGDQAKPCWTKARHLLGACT